MSNPLAHLIAQAELNIADLSRRAVQSVTVPVKVKSQELITEITEAVTARLKVVAIKAGLGAFAGVMAIIALSFALSALHGALIPLVGPLYATLIMAGAFLVLAIVAVILMLAWPTPSSASTAKADASATAARAKADAEAAMAKVRGQAKDQAKAAGARVAADADAAAAEPQASPLDDMKSGMAAIASALGEAGFRREQAGLRAGLALAEQLKPMQLVMVAMLGGFFVATRRRRR